RDTARSLVAALAARREGVRAHRRPHRSAHAQRRRLRGSCGAHRGAHLLGRSRWPDPRVLVHRRGDGRRERRTALPEPREVRAAEPQGSPRALSGRGALAAEPFSGATDRAALTRSGVARMAAAAYTVMDSSFG